jgi:hypothetical protein
MATVTVTKDVPVIASYDVVVAGGGPAGFIAAIAAAREGAKTALIERYGFFGGMATAGYVMPISVFSYNDALNIGGIPWEFIKRLEEMGGAYIEQPLHNIAFDPELYKLCAQRMVQEAGVDVYTHSYLSGCIAEDRTITTVIIENKNGSEAIEGALFIDATGDADLAHMSGVEMQSWEGPLQPSSMCFILRGVDTKSERIAEAMHHNQQGVNCHSVPIREQLIALSKTEEFPNFGGPWFSTVLQDGSVGVNMTRIAANGVDNRDYSHAERTLREDIYKLTDILRRHVKEFEHCYVASVATQAGIRETRHIKGVHIITADEYLNAYRYHDSISRSSHPIDIHAVKGEAQECRFLEKAAYVPYRSLITTTHPNLLVAGRSLSADREAFASLRVQASCMGMGQAAGVAAAMAHTAKSSVQEVDTDRLIERLIEMGAVLQ